jgi:Tol biopolymer transport system component
VPADSSASPPAPVERLTGIYLINVDGTGLCMLTSTHKLTDPVWSPDGGKIAFSDKGEINVINTDGSRREELAAGTSATWSPDGQKLAFFCSGNDISADHLYLCVINADGTERTRLAREVPAGGYPLFASWGSG